MRKKPITLVTAMITYSCAAVSIINPELAIYSLSGIFFFGLFGFGIAMINGEW